MKFGYTMSNHRSTISDQLLYGNYKVYICIYIYKAIQSYYYDVSYYITYYNITYSIITYYIILLTLLDMN